MRNPLAVAVLLMVAQAIPAAQARPGPQWAEEPANIRDWFQHLMQPDNPYISCCGEADAFEADTFEVQGDHYVAIITDGHGQIPNGTRIPVPNTKMKWDAGNPTSHGIIFINPSSEVLGPDGTIQPAVYCYCPPSGV